MQFARNRDDAFLPRDIFNMERRLIFSFVATVFLASAGALHRCIARALRAKRDKCAIPFDCAPKLLPRLPVGLGL
jgi:hypothetical protein